MPDTGSSKGQPYDGVDFQALIDSNAGIYYGDYTHATGYGGDGVWDYSTYTYEGTTKPVLWRVMGEEAGDGKLTVLSEYVLDGYNFEADTTSGTAYNYDASDMKSWLNTAFTNIFSAKEQSGIAATNVVTGMYDYSDEDGEEDEITGANNGDGLSWPITSTGQKLYLPWGKVMNWGSNQPVYWSAGNDANAAYKIADYGTTLKGGAEYDTAGGSPWWLRSPYSDFSFSALSVWGGPGGGYVTSDPVDYPLGVRPAFKLNPESVIFTSEILDYVGDNAGATSADENYIAAEGGDAKNYKLTVVNESLSLSDLKKENDSEVTAATNINIELYDDLVLKGTASDSGNSINYKIVADTGVGREIVGYGVAAESTTGFEQELTIDTSILDVEKLESLDDGDPVVCTVYVWEQKNNEKTSNEGSVPKSFDMTVYHSDNDDDDDDDGNSGSTGSDDDDDEKPRPSAPSGGGSTEPSPSPSASPAPETGVDSELTNPYIDVFETDWFYSDVLSVTFAGLMKG
ncbi:MAG: DUF6273 domain-containing protein, partial [Oscillospiraceae bacterium]|nr:DUF6273 domain-containing protein [Oscillospiraceae bacterium]